MAKIILQIIITLIAIYLIFGVVIIVMWEHKTNKVGVFNVPTWLDNLYYFAIKYMFFIQ